MCRTRGGGEKVPNLLRELRGSKSQSEIAAKIGISQQAWSSWESGRTVPKPCMMQLLEDMFQTKKEEIFFNDFNYKM